SVAAGNQPGTFIFTFFDICKHPVQLSFGNQGAQFSLTVQTGADNSLFRFFLKCIEDLVIYIAVYKDTGSGTAVLPRVIHCAVKDAVQGSIKIRIIEYN